MTESSMPSNGYITYGQMNIINDFRMLWTEIAIWIRSFMVSTITEFSDSKAISDRLYRIADDFKDKLQPFFGMEVAENLHQLLLWYIINIQTMITALYHKDPITVDSAVTSLYRISDELSTYLATINPFWSKEQWESLLNGLNEMIIAEEIALIGSEYEREIGIRDRIFRQARLLGDYMAAGVMHFLVPAENPSTIVPSQPSSSQDVFSMSAAKKNQDQCLTYGHMNLISEFRSLWADAALYLRNYILSTSAGLDKLSEAITLQLYHAAAHFESKLEPFFGSDISEKFEQLFLEFLFNAQNLIRVSALKDEAASETYISALYNDIDEISTFLASINPYWNKDQWQSLLTRLVENGIAELVAFTEEQYEHFLEHSQTSLRYTQMIGDYMANGLIAYLQPQPIRTEYFKR